jgi:hypothetical protein
MDADVLMRKLASNLGMDEDAYEQVIVLAEQQAPRQHRAEADARHLAALWNLVSMAGR